MPDFFDNSNEEADNFDDTSDGWVPDAALENLVAERTLHPGETNPKTTKRILDENAPLVVQSIVNLALRSKSERTRLDAGKYVLDRVLGRVGDGQIDEDDDPLRNFFQDVSVENFINAGKSTNGDES